MRMIFATILCLSAPACAEDTHAWGYFESYQSTIRLQPTNAPGAVAEVEFMNRAIHADEDVTFFLDMGDLMVMVTASVGRGSTPDRITVTPPDGYLAIPDMLDVAEEDVGKILIVPFLGM